MNRRSLLTGITTTLLASTAGINRWTRRSGIALVERTTIPAGIVYGRSPMMEALPTLRELETMIAATQSQTGVVDDHH